MALDAIYETDSTLLILQGTQTLYSKLAGTPNVERAETTEASVSLREPVERGWPVSKGL